MARRKPAVVHGILAIDKPAGATSRQVVSAVCRLLGERRAGHAGTLDPAATGVLVVAFGRATKVIQWLMQAPKAYRATVVFGAATSTDDAEGEVLRRAPVPDNLDEASLQALVNDHVGLITQVPPAVSALKRDGVRDHERVRRGEPVAREGRPVLLRGVDVMEVRGDIASFTLRCGSGFYVRAWARDLGEKLGSAAFLRDLRRTESGCFVLRDCITLTELERLDMRERRALLAPLEAVLPRLMPVHEVGLDLATQLRDGRRPPAPGDATLGMDVLVRADFGPAVCVAAASLVDDEKRWKVVRGFPFEVPANSGPSGEQLA